MNRGVIFALGLVMLSASAFARTEKGSFLERPVHTTKALVSELGDSQVLDRYVRHFGMGRSELVKLFSSLHLARIREAGSYIIYMAEEDGSLGQKKQKLKAGTLVFANATGKPILKESCGNPMVSGTDAMAPGSESAGTSKPSGFRVVGEGEGEQGLIPTEGSLTNIAPPETLVASNPGGSLIPADVTPSLANPTIPGTQTLAPSAGGANLAWLGWLAPVALLSQLGQGGGNNGGNPAQPVPEPITLVVLSAGAVGLMKRRPKA